MICDGGAGMESRPQFDGGTACVGAGFPAVANPDRRPSRSNEIPFASTFGDRGSRGPSTGSDDGAPPATLTAVSSTILETRP